MQLGLPRDKRTPLLHDGPVVEEIVRVGPGSGRLPREAHFSLLGREPGLAMVARYASADHVLPGVLAASGPGGYVVYSESARLESAVLAGELVPVEYRPARKTSFRQGPFHHIYQTDYRWDLERLGHAAYVTASVGHRLGLPEAQ